MNFELNFEELQKKLRKILNPSRFRFVIILYPNTNTIKDIKEYISKTYQEAKSIDLELEGRSYQDIASDIYQENSFVYIDDFEDVLDNPDLYNGFNQRRDKIASHNINLICFLSLYKKDELFTKALNVIPDLWEFKNTVLELEKDKETDKLLDIKVQSTSSYSSIGGISVNDKRLELEKLLKKLDDTKSDELKENILYQIATIYRDIGDYEQSLIYLKEQLNLKKQLCVSEEDISVSYNNISSVYRSLENLEEALKYQIKALIIRENLAYGDDKSLAFSYNNISEIYRATKEFDKALEYQKKAIKIREDLLSSKHPDLGQSYHNMSGIYLEIGEFEKALMYQKKALEIFENILDEYHPDLAFSYIIISQVYFHINDFNKAKKYINKAVSILKSIFSNRHPHLDLALKIQKDINTI